MNKKAEKKKKFTDQILKVLAKVASEALEPFNFGFCLLIFPKNNKNAIPNYISDCKREDMIKLLRDTADRIEKNNV